MIDRSLPLRRVLKDVNPHLPRYTQVQIKKIILDMQHTIDTAMDNLLHDMHQRIEEIIKRTPIP
jgi:hypothetical protein